MVMLRSRNRVAHEHRSRQIVLCSLGLICLVGAACGGSSISSVTTQQQTSPRPALAIAPTTTTLDLPPPDPFHVVGTQILDPNGDLFYPIGANVAISVAEFPYVFEGGNGGINDHVADIETWNWNIVRATLKCHNENGPTTEQVVAGIDRTIKELTAARIVVMIECHDGTGSDVLLDSEIEKNVGEFWDLVVENYKDNPYVWFNFFNEPFGSDDLTNWKSLHDFYIKRYRAISDNIIVVDLPYYGQGLNLFEDEPLPESFTDACNVVFGWHAYGSLGDDDLTANGYTRLIKAVQTQDVAIIVSEVGYVDDSALDPDDVDDAAGGGNFNEARKEAFEFMIDIAPETGLGLMWWHATGDTSEESLFRLKNDGSGFWTSNGSGNLTEGGQKFWDFSQADHEIEPFEGTAPTGGCSTDDDVAGLDADGVEAVEEDGE